MNKKIVLGACLVYIFGFALGYYSGNIEEQKHLDTIRNLEKTDYRTVLYGWAEGDYINNHTYDNDSDYVNAVRLRDRVYQDINSRYENHLVNNLLKVDLQVTGSDIKDNRVIREISPMQLESRDGYCIDYCYSYDLATHTLYINIDYFKLQSRFDRELVFGSSS